MQKTIIENGENCKKRENRENRDFFYQKSNLLFEYLLNTVKPNPDFFCGC